MSDLLKSLEGLYTQGKVEEAINLLKENEQSLDRPLFHYNLGTMLVKNKQLPQARFHLEVAKILGFKPSMVDNNIEYVKENLGLMRLEEPRTLSENYYRTMEGIPREYFVSFFLVCILIGLYFYRKLKRAWVLILFICLSMTFPLAKVYQNQLVKVGIVSTDTPLREGPSEVFEQTGELPAGLKVFISEIRDGSWYFVESPKPFRGWVELKYLNIIGKKNEKLLLDFM